MLQVVLEAAVCACETKKDNCADACMLDMTEVYLVAMLYASTSQLSPYRQPQCNIHWQDWILLAAEVA